MAPLSEAEKAGLAGELPAGTPLHVAGDIPEWLMPSFERAFGSMRARKAPA